MRRELKVHYAEKYTKRKRVYTLDVKYVMRVSRKMIDEDAR